MVEVDTLSKYGEKFEELKKINIEEETRKLELFFSFDVVNSTSYKTVNQTKWASILTSLFRELQNKVKSEMVSSQIWRVLGDEIIFVVQVKEIETLTQYVDNIFSILTYFVNDIKSGDFFTRLNLSSNEISDLKTQNIISLQSSAWIAIIKKGIDNICQYDNLLEEYEIKPGYTLVEFLGNDIDTGFRLTKETQDRRLIVSFELAYFLSKNSDYLFNLNIITYKSLKGVWNNRPYPIIWYHNPVLFGNVNLEESFYYDEKGKEKVKDYFDNHYFKKEDSRLINNKLYNDVKYALTKLAEDMGLENKINEIMEVVKKSKGDIRNFLDKNTNLELHCAALCFSCKERKLLVLKRSSSKRILKDRWEFGCSKAYFDKRLKESIKGDYKKYLNLDIDVIVDEGRVDVQPIPISLYEIGSLPKSDKGVIVLAKINSDIKNIKLDTKDYSEHKLISEEQLENFNKDKCVPDFLDSARKGFKIMQERGWK